MFIAIQLFHGLHHVTNIWRGTELGFNADDPYLSSIIGKTVTQITYYTLTVCMFCRSAWHCECTGSCLI